MYKHFGDMEKRKIRSALDYVKSAMKLLHKKNLFKEIDLVVENLLYINVNGLKAVLLPEELYKLLVEFLQVEYIFNLKEIYISTLNKLYNLYYINDVLNEMPYLASLKISEAYFENDEMSIEFLIELFSKKSITEVYVSSLRTIPYDIESYDLEVDESTINVLKETLPPFEFDNYYEYVNSGDFDPDESDFSFIHINYMDFVDSSTLNQYGSIEEFQDAVEKEVTGMLSEQYRENFAESYMSKDRNGIIIALSDYSFICNSEFKKDILRVYALIKGLKPKN